MPIMRAAFRRGPMLLCRYLCSLFLADFWGAGETRSRELSLRKTDSITTTSIKRNFIRESTTKKESFTKNCCDPLESKRASIFANESLKISRCSQNCTTQSFWTVLFTRRKCESISFQQRKHI